MVAGGPGRERSRDSRGDGGQVELFGRIDRWDFESAWACAIVRVWLLGNRPTTWCPPDTMNQTWNYCQLSSVVNPAIETALVP